MYCPIAVDNLKEEAVYSSDTSVAVYETIPCISQKTIIFGLQIVMKSLSGA
jgi:hypothetical protein